MADDQLDFSDKYNTQLNPVQEHQYQNWVAAQSKATGRDISKDTYDYDLRGYYQQNPGANLSDNHLTDQFKKPNHPTFSDQSKYNGIDGYYGGKWDQQPNGSYIFTAGRGNLYSKEDLQDYFAKVESGNTLNFHGEYQGTGEGGNTSGGGKLGDHIAGLQKRLDELKEINMNLAGTNAHQLNFSIMDQMDSVRDQIRQLGGKPRG